jgi:hypothetical protein
MIGTGVRLPPTSSPRFPSPINSLAQTHAAKFNGSLQDSMAEFDRIKFSFERQGEKLITFDQWQPTTWTEKPVGFDGSGCGLTEIPVGFDRKLGH